MATSALTEQWDREGLFHLDGFVESDTAANLAAEAASLRSEAKRRGVSAVEERRDGSFATPSRYSVYTDGDELKKFHRSRELLEILREVTHNNRLIPVRASYNYYDIGDYLGVHRDEIRSTVTLTLPLTEGLTPTLCEPAGRAWENDDIRNFIDANGIIPASGQCVPLKFGVLNGMDGYNIPHWRPPVTGAPQALAVFCYFRL